MKQVLAIVIAAAVLLPSCKRAETKPLSPYVKLQGQKILAPDGTPLHMRGFNVCWWVPPTQDDALNIKAMGANTVRYMFGYHPKGKLDLTQLECVSQQIPYFTGAKLWVIPVVHDFRKDKLGPYDSPELEQEFLDMWTEIITRFKDEPLIAAWEPINEPHDTTDEKVRQWYQRVIAHIRKLDPNRPIVVEGNDYSWPKKMGDYLKMDDTNVIYSFHWYGPFEYTHQKPEAPTEYPNEQWNRAWMVENMAAAGQFREKYNVPVWCGEWGVQTRWKNYPQWLNDSASILEEQKFPWTHWAWAMKPKDPNDGSFDINTKKKEIFEVLKQIFNKAVPSSQR